MKLGSLFDGSGACPLAAIMCGIEPVWASEIERYPIAVTSARMPGVKHLGDITKIDGAAIEPVDIITFGSPCQDLSVAGKQEGLRDGERSVLFYDAIRIVREMRGATNGKYPRYIMWENVPGAFSSNQGEDFASVLAEIVKVADDTVSLARPPRGKWLTAGAILADGYSVAWRTIDAQYWRVPQRRRRIFLVADFGGGRAGEILFERTRLPWYLNPRRAAQEDAAGTAVGCADRSGGVRCLNPFMPQSARIYDADGIYPALSANENGGMNRQAVVYPDVARTLAARYDGSPCIDRWQNVVAAFMGGQGADAGSIAYSEELSPRLRATASGSNQVPDVVVCEPEVAGALTALNARNVQTGERCNAVCYAAQEFGGYKESDQANTLQRNTQAGDRSALCVYPDVTGPLMVNIHPGSYTGQDAQNGMLPVVRDIKKKRYVVRRLTPLECCRLQGLPDWWTDGVPGSDSAKYKMFGNGMALPCVVAVLNGIKEGE